jgi:amino acid transporter
METGLVRGIGRWGLIGLTINGIIGSGIFGLPSRVFGLTGSWSMLAYLVCAVLITLITLCFAEVASRFSETGGPYLYARAAFGRVIGFEVGWLLWLARLTSFAALCNLLIVYISFFWPAAASGWTRAWVITLAVITMVTINLMGVREASLVNNIFAIGKLLPLLLFIVVGLFFVNPRAFSAPASLEYGNFSTAVMLLIYAYSGFEMTVVPSGETRDPRRHLPVALLTTTGLVAFVYILIQVVCIGTLPELAGSERPLVEAISGFLGAPGALILSAGALISITGTLNASLLAAPRILYAMAEQGQLPGFLASTHPRFRTPHNAIVVSAAVMLVLTLQGTFMTALTISTVIRLVQYIATCVALPVLRARRDAPSPRFTAPAGVVVAVVATALPLWLLSNTPWREARTAGLAALLGLPVFLVWSRLAKSGRRFSLSQGSTGNPSRNLFRPPSGGPSL